MKRARVVVVTFAVVIAPVLLLACGGTASSGPRSAGTTPATPATQPAAASARAGSLYERLGGQAAITLVVNDFAANLKADDAIKLRFDNTVGPVLDAFKANLVTQICEATGGPCKYAGKNMREAHAGMKISNGEFGALVADLKKALDKYKVPAREQTELLTALASMQPEVVNQ